MILKIGTASADSGSKARGYIKVAEYVGGQPVQVPVIIVHGRKNGPNLWIEACVHGDEYHNVPVLLQLARSLEPATLRGSVIIIPTVNVSAVQGRQRESMVDHADLNRSFPGSRTGFFSDQYASVWFQTVISNSDFFIDLHTSGMDSEIADFAIYSKVGKKKTDSDSKRMAMSFGFPYLVTYKYDRKRRGWFDLSLATQCSIHGIPSLLVEFPGLGAAPLNQKKIQYVSNGIMNVLKELKMIDGKPQANKKRFFLDDLIILTTTRGGLFTPKVTVGQHVRKDEVLATVSDLFGEEVEEVRCPRPGIVLDRMVYPIVGTGSWVFEIGLTEN